MSKKLSVVVMFVTVVSSSALVAADTLITFTGTTTEAVTFDVAYANSQQMVTSFLLDPDKHTYYTAASGETGLAAC